MIFAKSNSSTYLETLALVDCAKVNKNGETDKNGEIRDGADFAAPRPYDGPYDEGDAADDAELPLEADCSPSPAMAPVPASRNPHRRYLDQASFAITLFSAVVCLRVLQT